MKALWIRVEAHEVDSVRIEKLADALDVDVVMALGHYVALGGALAEHSPEGIIADISDAKLERWAHWSGKRGRFAAAIREQLQDDESGEFSDWEESMGKLVERRAADRVRQEERRKKIREDRAARKTADDAKKSSADNTRRVRGQSVDNGAKSSATERNGTERNGTGDTASSSRVINSGSLDGRKGPALLTQGTIEELRGRLPQMTGRWFDHYYGDDNPDRRLDVVRQLLTLAAGQVVTYRRQPILAYDAERLDLKCLEMLEAEEQPRTRTLAIAVLFTMLGDTSDISAAGELPGQREAAAIDPTPSAIEQDFTDRVLRTLPTLP